MIDEVDVITSDARTSVCVGSMSAFGGKADMAIALRNVRL